MRTLNNLRNIRWTPFVIFLATNLWLYLTMDKRWVIEVLNTHIWFMCLGYILLRWVDFDDTARKRKVLLWVTLVLGGVLVFLGIPHAPVVLPFTLNDVMDELIYRSLMTAVLIFIAVDLLYVEKTAVVKV